MKNKFPKKIERGSLLAGRDCKNKNVHYHLSILQLGLVDVAVLAEVVHEAALL